MLSSCGIIIFTENDCRDVEYQGEQFWYPESVGQSIVYIDSAGNERAFEIIKKNIEHVTRYYSDTGCSCETKSEMVLKSGNDTILFYRRSTYIRDDPMKTINDNVFMFDGDHSIFYEKNAERYEDLSIGEQEIKNCVVFEQSYDSGDRVNKFYYAEGYGIVRYIMQDGQTWTKEDLIDYRKNELNSFNVNEYVCE